MTAEPLEATRTVRAAQAHDMLVRRLRALADQLDTEAVECLDSVSVAVLDDEHEEQLVNTGAANAYRDAANRLRDITDPTQETQP